MAAAANIFHVESVSLFRPEYFEYPVFVCHTASITSAPTNNTKAITATVSTIQEVSLFVDDVSMIAC